MLAVEMKGITKRFPGMIANDQINFSVEQGEIHCLLGENGAGKSTLMKVLFGLYKPEEGEIRIKDKDIPKMDPNLAYALGIGMVHQHFMLVENLTVLENIILGQEPGKGMHIDRSAAKEKLTALSDKYGFALKLDKKISDLSVGEMQRVEIMKTIYRGADIIILDEPTAVLTPLEVDQLLNVLRDMRADAKTIVFITHKLKETMAVSDRVTVLRNGKSVATVNTADTTPQELANLMVGQPMSFEIIKPVTEKTTQPLFAMTDVKLTDNALHPVSLEIKGGEILGIAGVEGNGQQELEEFVVGLRRPKSGKITMGDQDVTDLLPRGRRELGLGYIPADRWKHGILRELSLKENYLLGNQFRKEYSKNIFIDYGFLETKSRELMKKFDVRAVGIEQKIGSLSGGNQQKLVLGREVGSDPCLVLACQPTRGLDIGAIQYIKQVLLKLRSEGKAVLLISADLTDLFQISDRIAVLYQGEVIAQRPAEDYTNESISLLMAGKKEETNGVESPVQSSNHPL